MLVSGMTRSGGEACVVQAGGGIALAPCLQVLASGSGAEVFRLAEGGLLESLHAEGGCVSSRTDSAGGGTLVLSSCDSPPDGGSGGRFTFTATGQLRSDMGRGCVVANGESLVVRDCGLNCASARGCWSAWNYR